MILVNNKANDIVLMYPNTPDNVNSTLINSGISSERMKSIIQEVRVFVLNKFI
tara:strand:+ start:292 stop:450 length:159 start_codon:yes stop_codon:yes gene_type:complete